MKRSRLAAAAALSMAILLNGCSTGYSSMEAPAGSKERIERNSQRPDQQEGNSGDQGSGRKLPASRRNRLCDR